MIKDASFGIIPFIVENETTWPAQNQGASRPNSTSQQQQDKQIKYLVIHQQKGHWSFPKGHAEEGETPLQTAKRELEEETGIQASKIFPQHFDESYTFTENGQEYDKTVTYFVTQVNDTKVDVQEEEVQGYGWMNLSEALETITFDQARQLIKQVDQYLQNEIKNSLS